MDRHFQYRIGRRTGIASQALIPRKTPMRALCSGLSLWWLAVFFLLQLKHLRRKNDGLRTKQLDPPTPDGAAWPITPQDWERSGFGRRWRWERLKQHRWSFNGGRWRSCRSRCVGRGGPNHRTDLPWLAGRRGFLTLRSKRTGTAMARASAIHNAQRAIALRSALLHR
jgi:hypothetical protein